MSYDLSGTRIDYFRLDAKLGDGTTGTVYRATDIRNDRRVAVKVIQDKYARSEAYRQHFLQQMHRIAGLRHPHLVRTHTSGTDGALLYLVMDYVDGVNLSAYRNARRKLHPNRPILPLTEGMELMRQLAQALHYLHDQRIVHLAVKPENILIRAPQAAGNPPQALLSDTGMRTLFVNLQSSGVMSYDTSLDFIAPEMLRNEPESPTSDIYLLGLVLYLIVTDRLPFPPTNDRALAYHRHTSPTYYYPLPSSVRPGIPPELDRIIMTCLAKNARQRYATTAEISRDLGRLIQQMQHQQSTAVNPGTPGLSTRQTDATLQGAGTTFTKPQIQPNQAGQDRILVFTPQPPTTARIIDRDILTVGRDTSADIVIDNPLVSRFHVRIERTGVARYKVTDLGSTNGSWVGSRFIRPNQATEWYSGEAIRIGDVRLVLEVAETRWMVPAPNFQTTVAGEVSPTAFENTQAQEPLNIDARLDNYSLVVTPGVPVPVTLTITNEDVVDNLNVSVRLINPDWVTIDDPSVEMLPNDSRRVALSFTPPQASTSTAGVYPFEVVITSRGRPHTFPVTLPGQVRVQPFYNLTSDLHPLRLRDNKQSTLTLKNMGNTPQTVVIEARDAEDALRIIIDRPTRMLDPGQQVEIPVKLHQRQRRLFGGARDYPFEVTITEMRADAVAQPFSGTLSAKGLLPPRVLTLGILLLGFCGVMSLCSVAGLVQLGRNAGDTRERINLTNTARSDVDGDELEFSAELTAESDPENFDTDGDGLNDGEEVRVYGTDPTLRDTDGDLLNDFSETMALDDLSCLSPTNEDSDGDGIIDGLDPDPCGVEEIIPPTLNPIGQ